MQEERRGGGGSHLQEVSLHDKIAFLAKMARSGDNLSQGNDIFPIPRKADRAAIVKGLIAGL